MPRYDVGVRHFDLELYVAESLLHAGGVSGRVPCREGDALTISWRMYSDNEAVVQAAVGDRHVTVEYTVATSPGAAPVFVSGWGGNGDAPVASELSRDLTWTKIEGTKTCSLVLPVSSPTS